VYPLGVILIGCGDDVAQQLRCELINNAATVESEFGDVAQTVEMLRLPKGKRRVLILQLKVNLFEGLDDLGCLRQAFPNWPVLVLMELGGEDRIQLTSSSLNVMRTGASQIVGLPLHPREFNTALLRIAEPSAVASTDQSQVFTVAGVTGGCGATSLAINLGQEFVHIWNSRCILVDLSLKLGAIASHLNIEPLYSMNDLLSDMGRVDEVLIRNALVRIKDNFELLPGPNRLAATPAHSSGDVLRLLDILKPLCDVVLLDLPCTYDDFYFEIIAGSDQVVLVGEPKVPSIRALKLVREMVGRDESCETEHLVINRFDEKAGSLPHPLLARILGVKKLHTISQDISAFSDAVNRGGTLRTSAPYSLALTEIDEVAKQLMERDATPKGRPRHGSLTRRQMHASV
jgi:pilus assembly protein CpaE